MGMIRKIMSMKKINIFIMSLGIISLFFIMVGVRYSSNYWGVLSGTLGTIMFANILLEYINKGINKKEDLKEICKCLNSEVNAIGLGINKIDIEGEKQLSLEKIIGEAKTRIDILHVQGLTWTKNNDTLLINALKNKELQMRIIISDFEDSSVVDIYKKAMGIDISKNKQEFIKIWKRIYEESGSNENLEIILFNGIITHAVHINEKNIIIKSIPTCKKKNGLTTVTIFAERSMKGIYSNYNDEIIHIINESRPYEFK